MDSETTTTSSRMDPVIGITICVGSCVGAWDWFWYEIWIRNSVRFAIGLDSRM